MEDPTVHSIDNLYSISVVVPAYNREKTIKRCIDSILNQSYPVFEIIVVDDGSTDKTLDILNREYSKEVTVIKQKHKGAQAARNLGIQVAKGEYIAFLDSDDEWVSNKLELQVKELDKNKDVVVCGNGYIQTDWTKEVPMVYRKSGNMQMQYRTGSKKIFRMNGKNGFVYDDLLRESFCLFQALLTSKENLIRIGLLDENVPSFQEWDTAIKLAQIREFAFIRKPLFVYYLHDGETISKNPRKNIDGLEYICDKYKYEILSRLGNKELVKKYKQIMQKCILYKDKRALKYLIRYILGTINLFILK